MNRALAVRYIRIALEDEPRIEPESIGIALLAFTAEEKRFEINFTPAGFAKPEILVWGFGFDGLALENP